MQEWSLIICLTNVVIEVWVKDVKMVPEEEVVRQHHLSVIDFKSLKARSVCSKGNITEWELL